MVIEEIYDNSVEASRNQQVIINLLNTHQLQ